MNATKVIGVIQIALGVFAGLAGLGIIHPDPALLAWLLGGTAAAGGANKIGNGGPTP